MKRLILPVLLCCATVAPAQEIVGEAEIDGQTVTLFSDFSWDFASDGGPTSDCLFNEPPITFCGAPSIYENVLMTGNPDVDAMYRVSDTTFAMLIVEGFGENLGITEDSLAEIVLENLGMAMGVPGSQVTVLERSTTRIGNQDYPTIVYSGDINGLPIVYSNTLVVQPERNAQLITYELGETYSEDHRRVNERFLSAIEIEK